MARHMPPNTVIKDTDVNRFFAHMPATALADAAALRIFTFTRKVRQMSYTPPGWWVCELPLTTGPSRGLRYSAMSSTCLAEIKAVVADLKYPLLAQFLAAVPSAP